MCLSYHSLALNPRYVCDKTAESAKHEPCVRAICNYCSKQKKKEKSVRLGCEPHPWQLNIRLWVLNKIDANCIQMNLEKAA